MILRKQCKHAYMHTWLRVEIRQLRTMRTLFVSMAHRLRDSPTHSRFDCVDEKRVSEKRETYHSMASEVLRRDSCSIHSFIRCRLQNEKSKRWERERTYNAIAKERQFDFHCTLQPKEWGSNQAQVRSIHSCCWEEIRVVFLHVNINTAILASQNHCKIYRDNLP
jgi:hypothetical protein